MPKIRIKERDLTTNPLVGSTTNDILYVADILEEDEAPRFLEETDIDKVVKEEDKTFLKKVLELGGRIVVADKWQDALDYCSDRNQYDIKFILAKEGETAIAEEPAQSELEVALTIAQKRKDCIVVYSKTTSTYNKIEQGLLKAKCNLHKRL